MRRFPPQLGHWVLMGALLLLTGCSLLGGAFENEPEDIDKLSPEALALVDRAYADTDITRIMDYHTHLVGLNPETNGTFVNEGWLSLLHPVSYLKFLIYMSAAGVTDKNDVDKQYLNRLQRLILHLPGKGKFGVMGFDYFHHSNGEVDKNLTTFHVPNHYMMKVVKSNSGRFFPIISIHPYRKNATLMLQEYARQGVRFVKWLPNAMGIHPSSPNPLLRKKLTHFYRIMNQYNMVLISHTGDEKATEAEEFQHLGNPKYLDLPLKMGVKVVMAHVASLGECKTVESSICEPGRPYLDIALEMMRDSNNKDLLFADISALTQFNRKHSLDRVIAAKDIHGNLINGSDYPLPAVNFIIQTRALVRSGHITSLERKLLNEIYDVNPLLFDYVLKRTLRHSKTGKKFPPSIFMKNDRL